MTLDLFFFYLSRFLLGMSSGFFVIDLIEGHLGMALIMLLCVGINYLTGKSSSERLQ